MVSNGMYKPIKPNSLITSLKGENKHSRTQDAFDIIALETGEI